MGLRNILSPLNQQQTSQSRTLGGGILSLFEPGTTTFIQSFGDSGLVNPLTQPIRLSGSGRADVWINQDCDLQLTDRLGNLILFQENANPDALGASESGGLIANGSFEQDTTGDGTPDVWVATDDPGSTNARDTTESTDGAASYRFTSSGLGGGTLTTENFFPVNDTEDLRVEFDLFSTVAAVQNIVRVEWYDVSQISISDTDVYDSTANPITWTNQQLSASPPALARFAKLKLIGIDPAVLLAGSTYFDNVSVFYPTVVNGIFDNIELVNNSIITTNLNGDLFLSPDGTGAVNITSADPVDLADAKNALNTGSLTPSIAPHIAFDFSQIQAKADGTSVNDLQINILGGSVDIGASGETITIGGVLEADEGIGTSEVLAATSGPRYIWDDGLSAANNSRFDMIATNDQLIIRLTNDADSSFASVMTVDRTLNVVDLVTFGGPISPPRVYLPELAAGTDLVNQGQLYVNASNQLIYRDEAGAEVNLSTAGAGAPGGAANDVQYNGGAGFAGENVFTYDDTNNRMSVPEIIRSADDFYIFMGDRIGNEDGLPESRITSSGDAQSGFESEWNFNISNASTINRGFDGYATIGMGGLGTDGFIELKAVDNAGADGDPLAFGTGAELRISGQSDGRITMECNSVTVLLATDTGVTFAQGITTGLVRSSRVGPITQYATAFTVTTGTKNLDLSSRTLFYHTLAWGGGAVVTFAFTNPDPAAEGCGDFWVQTINAANGSIVWPANVVWQGGVVPTPTAGKDLYHFFYRGGQDFIGQMFASNVS